MVDLGKTLFLSWFQLISNRKSRSSTNTSRHAVAILSHWKILQAVLWMNGPHELGAGASKHDLRRAMVSFLTVRGPHQVLWASFSGVGWGHTNFATFDVHVCVCVCLRVCVGVCCWQSRISLCCAPVMSCWFLRSSWRGQVFRPAEISSEPRRGEGTNLPLISGWTEGRNHILMEESGSKPEASCCFVRLRTRGVCAEGGGRNFGKELMSVLHSRVRKRHQEGWVSTSFNSYNEQMIAQCCTIDQGFESLNFTARISGLTDDWNSMFESDKRIIHSQLFVNEEQVVFQGHKLHRLCKKYAKFYQHLQAQLDWQCRDLLNARTDNWHPFIFEWLCVYSARRTQMFPLAFSMNIHLSGPKQ